MNYSVRFFQIDFPARFYLKAHQFQSLNLLFILTALFTTIFSIYPSKSLAQKVVLENSDRYLSVTELAGERKSKEFNNYPSISQIAQQQNFNSQSNDYVISPHLVEKEKINPFTTSIILNGVPIDHLTEWKTVSGYEFGDERSDDFIFSGIIKLNGKIQESLTKNNVFTVEQTGEYLQLQTVRSKREVKIESKESQTMMGMGIQLSFVGSCFFPGSDSENQCTYIPGLETDRNSINPEFLIPTRIVQTSKVGDILTPESLAVMKLPGFQMGANGQKVGVDLYFPNVGVISDEDRVGGISINRQESFSYTPTATYSRVKQIVRANDKEAVLGLTIRGWTGIIDDDNILLNSALQLSTEFLPDVIPQIEGSSNKVNSNVNKNLFFAAKNTRIPNNSFTIYHAGLGRAASPTLTSSGIQHTPSGKFNSLWLGLSPVIKRHHFSQVRYDPTSAERLTVNAGAEGGADQDLSLVSTSNEQNFSTAQIEDFYSQIYLQFFERDVNYVASSRLKEETNYYPHLSFSGNITRVQDVFRYYGGVVFSDELKPYLGLDYTKNTADLWTYSTGAIAYLNADPEYYSQILGNISKTIPLSEKANLVLSTSFNYIIDQNNRFNRAVVSAPESSVTTGVKANFGAISIGLISFFGGILPDSIDNSLLTSLEVRLSKHLQLSAYYTPINNNDSRSRYGANAQVQLGNKKNSPTLTFSWTNNEYDFGRDASSGDLVSEENVFRVLLKIGY
jgi:hypothetical protein